MKNGYFAITKPDLQGLCRDRALPSGGLKTEIVARLLQKDLEEKEKEMEENQEKGMQLGEEIDEWETRFSSLKLTCKNLEDRLEEALKTKEEALKNKEEVAAACRNLEDRLEEALKNKEEALKNKEEVAAKYAALKVKAKKKINELGSMLEQKTMNLATFKTPSKLEKEILISQKSFIEFKNEAARKMENEKMKAKAVDKMPADKKSKKKKKKKSPRRSSSCPPHHWRSPPDVGPLSQLAYQEMRAEKQLCEQFDELQNCD